MAIDHEISSQHSSLFFRLPPELRNKIYTQLLCPDAVTLKTLANDNDRDRASHTHIHHPTPLYPSILSTCRRINEEAGSLLYERNVFRAHPSLLTSLPHYYAKASSLPVCHSEPLSIINRWELSLRLDTDARFSAAQAAKAFSGAEYLEIRIWQAQFEACDLAVLRLLMDIRGVRVARVLGLEREDVRAWLEGVMMSEGEGVPVEKEDLKIEGEVLGWGLDGWRFS